MGCGMSSPAPAADTANGGIPPPPPPPIFGNMVAGALEDLKPIKASMVSKLNQSGASEMVLFEELGNLKETSTRVFRIEKTKLAVWPEESHGDFYAGDVYLVFRQEGARQTLYLWTGRDATPDETTAGAFKLNALAHFLEKYPGSAGNGAAPIQARESMGHESEGFAKLFQRIKIMAGGTGTAKKSAHKSRLLKVRDNKPLRITEVPRTTDSLNAGDVFVLDLKPEIFVWAGSSSSEAERKMAAEYAEVLSKDRLPTPPVTNLKQGENDGQDDAPSFWSWLGGWTENIKSAEDGSVDDRLEFKMDKELMQLSDESGKMTFKQVATGDNIKRSLLNSKDVFIFNTGNAIFVWIGKDASIQEKVAGLAYGQSYLATKKAESMGNLSAPLAQVSEGAEGDVFDFHMGA